VCLQNNAVCCSRVCNCRSQCALRDAITQWAVALHAFVYLCVERMKVCARIDHVVCVASEPTARSGKASSSYLRAYPPSSGGLQPIKSLLLIEVSAAVICACRFPVSRRQLKPLHAQICNPCDLLMHDVAEC
jgi:hypothetical protein